MCYGMYEIPWWSRGTANLFSFRYALYWINSFLSGRPLIVTTNLPLKELKNETMLEKKRIYDRILEMCTPIYVGGTSKREKIANMKMNKAKKLLDGAEGRLNANE